MSDGDFPLPGEVGEEFFRVARYPQNIGSLDNPSGQGAAVGKCGDSIEVSLRIDMGAIPDYYQRDALAGSTGSAE